MLEHQPPATPLSTQGHAEIKLGWKETNMDISGATTHAFVIRIWVEEAAMETISATWSGHITHVGDDRRRYIRNLDEIRVFVLPYLDGMGVRLSLWNRSWSWWRRLKSTGKL